jgi:hypothetical protein
MPFILHTVFLTRLAIYAKISIKLKRINLEEELICLVKLFAELYLVKNAKFLPSQLGKIKKTLVKDRVWSLQLECIQEKRSEVG